MLIHHLFYSEASRLLYDDFTIHGLGVVNQIGILGKVCVAIFVFVSGYGLSYKYKDSLDVKAFYMGRFKKLLLNYWFIWLVFVPIGVFVFHRTFEDAYGSHYVVKSLLDFFGVLNLTGQYGYNVTWWFYSCIIVLYIIFPLLNMQFEKCPFLILTLVLFAAFLGFIPPIQPWCYFILPFISGMLMERKSHLFKSVGKYECALSLMLLCVMRNFCGNIWFIVDTLICIGLAILLYSFQLPKIIDSVFVFLGKHSMNIFLFHTFIYYYWFQDIIYMTRNPFIIFLFLLSTCLTISIILEWMKKYTLYKIIRS